MAPQAKPFRNPLKQRLAEGRALSCVLLTMPGVGATQIWARSGVDMLVIDMEHGPIGIESLHAMIAATNGTPAVPLVRVPWNVPWLVKPVLDAGAMGIVFPMIAGAADAEAAVRSVLYPPAGERGWGPFFAQYRWDLPVPRYVETANAEVFTFLLIERPEAVENIREIVKVPGIDMLIVAPNDLAVTLGYPNQTDHPEVRRVIAATEEIILASGVPLCGFAPTPAIANDLIARGYRAVVLGFDWLVLQRAAAALIQGIHLDGGARLT